MVYVLAGQPLSAPPPLACCRSAPPRAQAQVTVRAPGVTNAGTDQMITLQVSTDSDTLRATGLKQQPPADRPIASVLVLLQPGRTFSATTDNQAKPIVTDDGDITDTVTKPGCNAARSADALAPGEFGGCPIIAGQLPAAASWAFRAIQTHNDSTVSPTDAAVAGSSAILGHRAPVRALTTAASSRGSGDPSIAGAATLSIPTQMVTATAVNAYLTHAHSTQPPDDA